MKFTIYRTSAIRTKKLLVIMLIAIMVCNSCDFNRQHIVELPFEKEIVDLISRMTIEEKVGQLTLSVSGVITGPTASAKSSEELKDDIRKGLVGGYFNGFGAEFTYELQKISLEESRLGIPLLFGGDVIHGFKTIFPIPLAEAASWDMDIIERSSRVAATEATAAGLNWNFAPMVDITRDARWGRIAEGAGEDALLGSKVTMARVKGFQGKDLSSPHTLAACTKHLAAYGAPDGGRDYNTVDMSDRLLREIYLPPYEAAVKAGSATFMTSFNELNGVPATGNTYLLKDLLRTEWGFDGMVVSDYNSIAEMINHGVAIDKAEAGVIALEAGTDMDMEGYVYLKELPRLVKEGKISEAKIDEAVKRVLRLKYNLGLFNNPYLYSDQKREKELLMCSEHLETALEMAKKSIVLLKNENQLLPLKSDIKSIAVIGPLADNKTELNGTWSFFGDLDDPVTVLEGLRNKIGPSTELLYAKGCEFYSDSKEHFQEAIATAKKADVVIMAIGESAVMNGEAASRSSIDLPGIQKDLVREIHKTGKPIVALVFSGRPLAISWMDENIPAILETWFLGTQTGNAISEVLFGDYNPSGKLPVSFPRNVGQVPIYYNYKQTGRLYDGDYDEPASQRIYLSKYRDVPNSPLYPFGHGLSYTEFEYSEIDLSKEIINMDEKLQIKVQVKNVGLYDGEEVVQLYVRDLVGSVTRPVKELKGFEKIHLAAGETKEVVFELSVEDLSFYRKDMTFGPEPGTFHVFIGTSSKEVKKATFELSESS
ncbi:beta-glucosidase BglX [Fulvivirgaceae bacterium BMA10]|uniref:beta-glucosidase n=1 Tax=Splendidivirga corallicola TaxID=3051826 RepID=A0ABT8KN55_9BACT|nr:beta-glucosidase BglX [Fulvivirgaceae bacterium BMA10]